MQGISLSEAAHIAQLLPPQNITGASSATPINPCFSMKQYKHASVLVWFGAEGTQEATTLVVYLCATAAGGSPVAVPFNCYSQAAGGAGNDVLGSIQNVPSTGLVLNVGNAPANGVIVIEIDANELAANSVGGVLAGSLGVDSYIGIGLGSPAAADFAAVVVILTGPRDAFVSSPSVTT